jgi:hypothetical protein
MQILALATVVSRYVTGALIIVAMAFEFASLPLVFFVVGMSLAAPNLPKIMNLVGFFATFSPLAAMGILVLFWMWLERHRKLYPIAAFLLVAGWLIFLVSVEKTSVMSLISSYASWHLALFTFTLSLFGY